MPMRVHYFYWLGGEDVTINVYPDSEPLEFSRDCPITVFRNKENGQMRVRLTEKGTRDVGDLECLVKALTEGYGDFNRWIPMKVNKTWWIDSQGATIPDGRFMAIAEFIYRCAVE